VNKYAKNLHKYADAKFGCFADVIARKATVQE
jgi:hypothetical protein